MAERRLPDSFAEIRALIAALPDGDEAAAAAAGARQAQLTKPPGSLGRLEELAVWLARWQGSHPPRAELCFTAVFAANHGVAAQGVSAFPATVTRQMVQNFIAGGAAINQLCELADADLRIYEMALDEPTRDFSGEPAMDEADCARAMAYGMMAVADGIDLLALGEMGIANTTSAAALCHALFGGPAADWVGRGTGIDDERLSHKVAVVERAVALHRAALSDPLQVLRHVGGLELAAIAGAVLAARLARTPVVLDGYACTAAAAVLHALEPRLLDHCLVSHVSVEPGHARLLERLGKRALLDLGMRLGEGSGAMLAVLLAKAAAACHNGMATFVEAGVSGPGEK
ncbi:MAG: nicotinate-nucleotide--dimethylbenzimidazole phosphoribosyltransferase [Kiloniellales bacterium]